MVFPLRLKNKQNLTPEQRYLRPHISRVNELPNWDAPNWHAAPACRLINRHNISTASLVVVFVFLHLLNQNAQEKNRKQKRKTILKVAERCKRDAPGYIPHQRDCEKKKPGTICGPVDPGKVSAFHCQSLCASASVNCLTDAQIRQTHPPPFFQVNEPVREQCWAYLKAHKHRKRETNPTVLSLPLHREFQVLAGSEKFAHLAQTECGTIQRKILWFGFQKHPTRAQKKAQGEPGTQGVENVSSLRPPQLLHCLRCVHHTRKKACPLEKDN